MTEPFSEPQIDDLLAHRGWVRQLCRHLAASPAEADEVEQETWRRALETPPKHGSNLKAWFGAVVRSAAMQRHRGESRRSRAHERLEQAAAGEAGVDEPGSVLERRETFRVLSRLVGELEEPFGEVVYLRYVEGLPPRTIAKQLGLPVDLVKSRQHRGLKLLRQRVQRELGSDWRARCLVFVPTLPELAVTTLKAIAMTKTTQVAIAAVAVIASIPLIAPLLSEGEPMELESSVSEARVELPEAAAEPLLEATEQVDREPVVEVSESGEESRPISPRVRIQVRDFATREAIPFAEVLVMDPGRPGFDQSAYSGLWIRGDSNSRMESIMRDFGFALQADGDGIAVLESMYSRQVWVGAATSTQFHVEQWIEGDWEDEEWDLDLLLRPRQHLSFEVRDAQGQPVPDLAVTWMMRRGTETWYGPYMRARTDKDGQGTFFDLQTRAYVYAEAEQESYLVANVASAESVALRFDPRRPLDEMLVMELPHTIRVELEVPDELHPWLQKGIRARLSRDRDPSGRELFVDQLVGWTHAAETDYANGAAFFARVVPGFEGTLLMQLPQLTGVRGVAQAVAIPDFASDGYRLELEIPEVTGGIELQFADSNGEEVHRDFEVTMTPLRDGGRESTRLRVQRSDTETRFYRENAKWVESSPGSRPYFAKVWSLTESQDYSIRHHFRSFRFDAATLDSDPQVLAIELKNELLVSGQVVDQNGRALRRVQVRLSGDAVPVPGGDWISGPSAILLTDDDGRFELRGTRGLLKNMVLHNQEPRAIAKIDFTEGQADQVFELVLPTEIQGEVLADPEVPLASLGAFLVNAQDEQLVARMEILPSTGRLSLANLVTSGRIEQPVVLILRDSFGHEVFRSEAMSLADPGRLSPESLNPIDLRGKLHLFQVEVVDSNGEEVSPARFWEPGRDEPVNFESGKVLVSGRPYVDAVVDADGLQVSPPTEISGSQRIELQQGIEVEFQLPTDLQWDDPRIAWVLRLESMNSSATGLLVREQFLDPSGHHVALPHGGPWKIYLQCQRAQSTPDGERHLVRASRRSSVIFSDGADSMQVVIDGALTDQSLRLDVSQRELEQAIEELRR